MGKFLDVVKEKVDAKTVLGLVGGALTIVSFIVDKKTTDLTKHETAEEAAKIVMDKLSGKES